MDYSILTLILLILCSIQSVDHVVSEAERKANFNHNPWHSYQFSTGKGLFIFATIAGWFAFLIIGNLCK